MSFINMQKVFLFGILLLSTSLRNENMPEGDTFYDKGTVVIATVYHAVVEQCNSDPEHTASMFKLDLSNPYKHRIIAVSRDLKKQGFSFGTKVRLVGVGKYDGIYVVEDVMNKRYIKSIDILINKDMKIGKWKNVRIYKL